MGMRMWGFVGFMALTDGLGWVGLGRGRRSVVCWLEYVVHLWVRQKEVRHCGRFSLPCCSVSFRRLGGVEHSEL